MVMAKGSTLERFFDLAAPDQPLSIPELPRFSELSGDST
jgi:hypothetical protein